MFLTAWVIIIINTKKIQSKTLNIFSASSSSSGLRTNLSSKTKPGTGPQIYTLFSYYSCNYWLHPPLCLPALHKQHHYIIIIQKQKSNIHITLYDYCKEKNALCIIIFFWWWYGGDYWLLTWLWLSPLQLGKVIIRDVQRFIDYDYWWNPFS